MRKNNVILHPEICVRAYEKQKHNSRNKQNNNQRMKIKSYIYPLMLALVTLTSCLSDNDKEVNTNDYCYVSSVSLGALKRTIHTLDKQGNDSTYTVTLSGSSFPMSIDQRNNIIENRDSLPYGTRVNAVLATIEYQGIIGYKKSGDVDYVTYSAKDSIDFSGPIDIVVLSTSGTSERHYTMKLNVHKLDGDKFVWNQQADCADLSQLAERKMVWSNGTLYMAGKNADGTLLCASRQAENGKEWTVAPMNGAEKADISTLQADGNGNLLLSTDDGAILTSSNGTEWTIYSEPVAGRKLIGITTNCLYAMVDGTLQSSSDNGLTWKVETLDEKAELLPDAQFNLTQIKQDNGYTRLILSGCNAQVTDQKVVAWSKAWMVNESEAKWMFYPHTADNYRLCPQMSPFIVMPYDNGLIAMGGASIDGKQKAFEKILFSPDYGLTWSNKPELTLPAELEGCKDAVTATLDKDNFIWIVAGQHTWRGRLNRMGFAN